VTQRAYRGRNPGTPMDAAGVVQVVDRLEVDAVGRQVDVHPVTLDGEGGGIYQMEGDRTWVCPAQGFSVGK
jgi:hypothetical protein